LELVRACFGEGTPPSKKAKERNVCATLAAITWAEFAWESKDRHQSPMTGLSPALFAQEKPETVPVIPAHDAHRYPSKLGFRRMGWFDTEISARTAVPCFLIF